MSPILLRIGPLALRSYSTLVNMGLVLGSLLVVRISRQRAFGARAVLDAILSAAVGGLVLARASYVGVHWDYYAQQGTLALRVWEGGLLWQGALIGGLLGTAAICAVRGMPMMPLLDLMAPGAAVLSIFAWLACFAAGCAWGVESYPGQRVLWAVSLDLPNLYGMYEPRVAVQLLGFGWDALLLACVLLLRGHLKQGGVLFSLWVMLHSLGAFALGFLRADQMPTLAGWRFDQLANLGLVAGGAVLGGILAAKASTGTPTSAKGRGRG